MGILIRPFAKRMYSLALSCGYMSQHGTLGVCIVTIITLYSTEVLWMLLLEVTAMRRVPRRTLLTVFDPASQTVRR